MTDTNAEFRPIVSFPDQSDSFVHGYEAGMIWQRMLAGEQAIGGESEMPTHSSNAEVFQRMADAKGYDLEIKPTAIPEWMIATFTKWERRFKVVGSAAAAYPVAVPGSPMPSIEPCEAGFVETGKVYDFAISQNKTLTLRLTLPTDRGKRNE